MLLHCIFKLCQGHLDHMEWKENNDLRVYLSIARTFSRCVSRSTWSTVSKRGDRSKITGMKKQWLKLSHVSTAGHLNPVPKACKKKACFLLICDYSAHLMPFRYWKRISVIVKIVSGSRTFGLVTHLKIYMLLPGVTGHFFIVRL